MESICSSGRVARVMVVALVISVVHDLISPFCDRHGEQFIFPTWSPASVNRQDLRSTQGFDMTFITGSLCFLLHGSAIHLPGIANRFVELVSCLVFSWP